ncbi:hypothetical protein LCGC14_1404160 [marine sediment metagenome]|uniref:Uncharacterized protein n=1 Tax=marine sediment metagenome TaxID=412755 RepID=A0A0F9JWF8_9ZZZZ
MKPDFCACDAAVPCYGAVCASCSRKTCHHRWNPGHSLCGSILCIKCIKLVETGCQKCPICDEYETPEIVKAIKAAWEPSTITKYS